MPGVLGPEQLIERRGIILRDPRDVITSVMNRGGRTLADFDGVVRRLLWEHGKLRALAAWDQAGYQVFHFHEVFGSVAAMQRLVDWTGIRDLTVEEADLGTRLNQNKTQWFPGWSDWDRDLRGRFEQIATANAQFCRLERRS